MNLSVIILQGAIGFGLMLIYACVFILISFSIGSATLYIKIGKKLIANSSNKLRSEILLYTIGIILGIITSLIATAVFLGIIYFMMGDRPLD